MTSRPRSLARRAEEAREIMDDPACDLAALRRTYAQFGAVNAVVAGWRCVYVRRLRPRITRLGGARLLDIGSGGGDVPRMLARWAARDRLPLRILAIDPDERAHAYAAGLPALPGLTFRRAYSSELVREGKPFDLVTSNHLLHHLDAAQLAGLLEDSELLCSGEAVHSDIRRGRPAYAAFAAGTLAYPPFRGSFIRADGLTSIRRSYTSGELRAAAPAGWRVERAFPYRNLLSYSPDGADPLHGEPARPGGEAASRTGETA